MRTFAELEQDENVMAAEVSEVLEDYVTSGAAINPSVVIGLINRTKPNTNLRTQMKVSAQKGKDDQIRRRFVRDAAVYEQVIRRLNQ
jgi:hypothetical protein